MCQVVKLLILVFFISVAGITLRKHFDKTYVKPLIVSVGLMLTVGVFRFKEQLAQIFEGWGILGAILLVVMVATIPYGLCRGFGLSNLRAFYLTYILIYILSWVKLPGFYEALAESNFGFVNLILLIVFFVAIFNVFKPGKLFFFSKGDLVSNGPVAREIDREMAVENQEKGMVADYQRLEQDDGYMSPSTVRRLRGVLREADPGEWRRAPEWGVASAVFLIGFPRSGTTLLEQVLASHPGVCAIEERPTLVDACEVLLAPGVGAREWAGLTAADVSALQDRYDARATQYLGGVGRRAVLVDKVPLIAILLPVIARIFPDARVILALRDPRDVVLSCYSSGSA